MKCAALITLVLVLQATAQIADPAQAAAIIAQLEDAPTSAARFNLLNGRDFVFDFNAGVGVAGGAGGNITVANLADFPFLLGHGMSLAVGKMAPCGLSTPHHHPRATEFLYMITGSNLKVGFIQENGIRFVSNVLNPGQGTIFPKGSIHYQANLDCEPVTFVAGLDSEDPGVGTVAQRFFGIPPDVADATLGDIGVDEVVRIAQSIPDTFALGVQSCLDKCKIERDDQPKKQQQPRVSGNEFPSNTSTGNSDDMGKPDDKSDGHDGSKNQTTPSTGGASPPSHRNRRDEQKDNSGAKKYPDHNGHDDGNSNHQKWSDVPEDRVAATSAVSSLISSADARTLEELVFFLKLIFCVLLSGYVFVWAYFVIPTWRDRRLQVELQARAAVSPSAPIQGVKA